MLKTPNAQVGRTIWFLVLEGTISHKDNGRKLEIRPTPTKARKWSELISVFLKKGRISFQELENPIGRMIFSQTSAFGKFARTQLRPLYRELRDRFFTPKLPEQERFTLRRRFRVLREIPHAFHAWGVSFPDFALYTEAASTRAKICAILFKGGPRTATIDYVASDRDPPFGLKLLIRPTLFTD